MVPEIDRTALLGQEFMASCMEQKRVQIRSSVLLTSSVR